MQVNTEIWGEPLAYFTQYNIRTGATDLTDDDFTDYPPFTYSNINDEWSDPSGTTYSYTIRAGIAANKFTPNEEYPDYSIAYVGMYNPDLPQCNIQCIGQTPTTASGTYDYEPCFITNPDEVLPIAFISNRAYRSYRAVSTYTQASRDFKNPFATSNQKRLYAPYSSDNPEQWNTRNISFDMAYWRSFGIRSVIGSIYVKYVDAELNSNGIPTTTNYQPVTLKYYKTQSDEWKTAHPICAAYMVLNVRTNTNGTYRQYNAQDSIMPDLTVGIKVNKNIVTTYTGDVPCISPSQMINGDGNNQAYLPIFGLPTAATGSEGGVLGQIGSTPSGGGMNTGVYPMFIGTNYGEIHHGTSTATYQRTCWITANDSTGDLDWIMRGAAAYGLFFTDGIPSDYPDIYDAGNDAYRWVNADMCLGIVDSNGYTNGDYTRGLANPTAPNFTWKDSTQSPYNPRIHPDKPNQYNDTTTFNTIGNLATMFKRYVINAANVEQLGRDLFKITADINTADVDDPTQYNVDINSSFLTNNPINCIISLKRFPLEIPSGSEAVENIKLGTHTCTAIGYPMKPTSYMFLYELADTIKPNFGDSYLDYSPYTEYELFVPFCGTVKLNPRDIIGRRLAVQSLVDFVTGTVTAFVMSNNLVIETVQGNIAIEIPVAGIDSATIAGNLNNAVANSKLAYTNTYQAAADLISVPKSVGGTFGKLANANVTAPTQFAQAQYDLTHQVAEPHVIGSASPVGLWAIDLNCRLICYFPTGDIISVSNSRPYLNNKALEYGATTGFACLISDKTLGEFSGMTTAVNPLLGGQTTNNGKSLTADELTLLEKALQDGIIL